LNRLVTVVDPANGNTTYNHDALDHVTDVADPKGLDTHYTYDAFGDVLTQTSPDTGTTTYTYDLDGNRLTKTDAKGVTATYTYDALNRLTGITYPDSAENVTYSYDQGTNGIGRLTTIVDQSGSTAYQYDTHGNVVTKTSTVDGLTFAVGYQYDGADDLTGITYPDGMQVTYGRDAAERITSVTATRNGVTQTVASGITYEPFGPLSGLTYGNGLTETRTHDQGYRLTSISVPAIEQWTLTDNADDDITAIADGLNSANSQAFGYDGLNRLTSAQGFYGTLGYHYDLDGNRTQLTTNGAATAYSYDTASNHLLSVVPAQAGTQAYSYDADGNLVNDGAHTYGYNDANRLTGYDSQTSVYLYNGLGQRVRKSSPVVAGDANGDGVIDQNDLHALQAALKGQAPITPGMDCNQDGVVDNKDKSCIATQIGSYKNQGKGKNSTTTTAAATTGTGSLYIYFAYDEAGHLIGEYDQNGNLIEEHIWLGNRPLSVATPSAIDYVTTDKLDTPRAITDSNKALVWSWSSDPFGNGDANTNPSGLGLFTYSLRFPGQYYDAETGHNYNYFRDYDPTTGRYIESDPLGLFGGINTYGYVNGNPIAYIDFYGLCWIYSQSTGRLTHVDDKGNIDYTANATADSGYSGYGSGLNNPAMQSVQAKKHGDSAGPIPQGLYIIGKPYDSPTTGPMTMTLTPQAGTNTFNRDLFRMHGDNAAHNHTASTGCIVEGPNVRQRVADSKDSCLKVIP
jgi:RHS repeat-associated protein